MMQLCGLMMKAIRASLPPVVITLSFSMKEFKREK
jgi:hypothetical protein